MNQNQIFQTFFDQMISSENNQFCKALIPYLPFSAQRLVSFYTKCMELSNTVRMFSSAPNIQACEIPESSSAPLDIIRAIEPYCYGEPKQQLNQMNNLLVMLEMFSLMNES